MRLRLMATAAAAIALTGCGGGTTRQPPVMVFPDMRSQERYDPQERSDFFSDGLASRRPVEGTVARGGMKDDATGMFTGIVNTQYVGRNPLTIDENLMATGQRRFNTYCSPCHDRTGQGRGVVAQRATWIPTNLHEARVKQFNDGEIFNVITMGRRSMPSYRFQTTENDRWAIVAYVRALQRTTSNTLDDMPADQRSALQAEAVRMAEEQAKAEAAAKEAAAKAAAEAAALQQQAGGQPAAPGQQGQPAQQPNPGQTSPAGQVK
jgi:mono/diheme cytochrome c family protein